jgi:type VI secretion system protein VasD
MNHSTTGKRSVFQSIVVGLLAFASSILLSACAGAPPPEPAALDMQINASVDVNPDMQGRPSPIILHIMELNSTEQFNRLDYMSLTQPNGAALGPELLGKNQLVLQPGENRALPMELNPQTTVIGLVAGYRDIDNATWRTNIPVTQGTTKGISITLGKQTLTSVSN